MTSPAPAPPASAKPPVRVWDVVVTSMLLIAAAGLTLLVAVFGLYLAEAAQACGVRDCNTSEVAVGMFIATVVPWVILGVAVVGSIILLARRRFAFWVPIAAAPLIVLAFFIGSGITGAGVPPP